MLSAARTRTEFAQRAFSVAALHTWNSLPSDIRSCHTLHTFKNTSKHTCLDRLSLKPPAPLYPLQDFKTLYKYCIIIITHATDLCVGVGVEVEHAEHGEVSRDLDGALPRPLDDDLGEVLDAPVRLILEGRRQVHRQTHAERPVVLTGRQRVTSQQRTASQP